MKKVETHPPKPNVRVHGDLGQDVWAEHERVPVWFTGWRRGCSMGSLFTPQCPSVIPSFNDPNVLRHIKAEPLGEQGTTD